MKINDFYSFIKKYLQNPTLLTIVAPVLFFLINFYLKARHISDLSIAGDEPFSIFISQMDVWSIIKVLSEGNNPPLFELILHFWTKLFGIGPAAVRFLPCLFSSLVVVMVYKIGYKFFNLRIAVLASVLFTLSNYQTYFAHETRVYSLFLLLTCVSFYCLMSMLQSDKKRWRVLHIVTFVLLPYGHYFGFFVLFVQGFLVLIIPELRRAIFKSFAIDLGVSLVFYIPFIPVFISRFMDSAIHGTWVAPVRNLGQLHDVIIYLMNGNVTCFVIFMFVAWLSVWKFFSEVTRNKLYIYTFVFISIFYFLYALSVVMPMPHYYKVSANPIAMSSYIAIVVLMLVYTLATSKVSVYGRILLGWFLVPLLVMFVSSFWVPMFMDRYLIYFTATFFILLALAVTYLDENRIPAMSVLVVVLLGITFTSNPDNNRHTKDLMAKVKELKTPNTVVYICPDYFDINFAYYYKPELFKDIDPKNIKRKMHEALAKENIYPIVSYNQIDTALIRKSEKVLYLDAAADFCYGGNNIKGFLDSKMKADSSYFYFEIFNLHVYKK